MAKKKPKQPSNVIVQNKKARHDFFIETTFEAGMVLKGWEIKSLREGKVQLVDSHVFLKNGEAWLLNAIITPLPTASTHFVTEPNRYRKLLLNKRELSKIIASVNQKGHTCVCTKIYWKDHLVKCEIALAKGKASHDKRQTEKERDWNREKSRVLHKNQ
ncbi:SsrA-binding protein [BD1-7 clade bacterium]|uniref:SsrA-binding protein n=1 Tax=BD1-7 clade bacterium TaxID=2029982 RepID=A0A5S9PF64_9GAMM|nr:SsrA-binding protein [BD1-7 clade bacterium]